MRNSTSKVLMNKIRELEGKYEWLPAAELYEKEFKSEIKAKNFAEAGDLGARIAFCFQKAALQANTPEQFCYRMKAALKAYNQSLFFFLKTVNKAMRAPISHTKAMIAYTNLWLENESSKKKALSDNWWNLENEALRIYEKAGKCLAVGKICNDLLQGSHDQRIFYALDWREFSNMMEQCFLVGEKAIDVLLNANNDYELARAYCWTSWYYSFYVYFGGYTVMREDFPRKSFNYAEKAMELSRKVGDANLIGWSSNAASLAAFVFEGKPSVALLLNEETQKQSAITRDKLQIAVAKMWAGSITTMLRVEEDPEKRRNMFLRAANWAKESIDLFKVSGWHPIIHASYGLRSAFLTELAELETVMETKLSLLREVEIEGREFMNQTRKRPNIMDYATPSAVSDALISLSRSEKENSEKKSMLREALELRKEVNKTLQRVLPSVYIIRSRRQYEQAEALAELSKIESDTKAKAGFLSEAISSMEKCIGFVENDSQEYSPGWKSGVYGTYYNFFGKIVSQSYLQTRNRKALDKAIGLFSCAARIFEKASLFSHAAEAYWQMAKLQGYSAYHVEAVASYESASEKYNQAAEKIPQLRYFYNDYSSYMKAWMEIECARYNHSTEKYGIASEKYGKAAKLHESTGSWNYLTSNYFAWAEMEKAEGLSRNEQTQLAKQTFQKALKQFNKAEESIREKLKTISSEEEREMNQRLLKASDLRLQYCQARIMMEDAKLLDRDGKYLQSSRRYEEAAQNISELVSKLDIETERKELEYLAILCRAWEKMAFAEETASSESYLDAAALFENAKEHCYTRKASLWALGNSNFCRGLAAGIKYQTTLSLSDNAIAKRHIENAAANYLQAGFKNASEHAKATLRLFDAYVFMNQAQNEIDPEKKARQYQMAEKLLQMSTAFFFKAKQTEKISQVKQVLGTVREEKSVALSLNEMIRAPLITSSMTSFTAPSPTNEASIGLEQFQHANVQANLIADLKDVKVGESFCLTVEFVNAGKEPALLTRVEDFVPPDFIVVKKPDIYRLEKTCLNMKGKQIAPLKLVEAKLILQPSKKGVYQLKPIVHYLDELGQNKSLQLKSVEVKVEEVILSDRVSTGTKELDSLLLGGIPREYAVVLTGPPSDERELIIRNFLEAGIKEGQTSFYVATEADDVEKLLEKSGFYLFLCNPKPKVEVPDLPNVTKLRSKTDLTNLNIALLKAYRNVGQSSSKRACINIISDVLVDHGVKTTRKWIAELTTDLVSKGFTVLAVMNPGMHPLDQATGVIDLFDGEITISQSGDPQECKKSLTIKKLRNQDYIKNPICLAKS